MSLLFLGGLLAWGAAILQGVERHAHMTTQVRRQLAWLAWRPVPPALPLHLLWVLAASIVFSTVLAWVTPGYVEWMQTHRIVGMFVSNLIFWFPPLIVVVLGFRFIRLPVTEAFDLSWRRVPGTFVAAIVAYALLLPPMALVVHAVQWLQAWMGQVSSMQPIFDQLAKVDSVAAWVLMFGMVVVLAPLAEEVVFRGVLLPWLSARFGVTVGVIGSSVLFAGIHLHVPSMLPLFILAIGLSVVFAWTRSLLSCIFLHAVFNAFTLVNFLLSYSPTSG